jgi:bifunctional DNA-binding transcriptional regulator/antitoxin component of YhaV-PrlF toxin-antitoxin module
VSEKTIHAVVKTTVRMNENGRIVVPKPARESLGVDGASVIVEVEVEVAEQNSEKDTDKR